MTLEEVSKVHSESCEKYADQSASLVGVSHVWLSCLRGLPAGPEASLLRQDDLARTSPSSGHFFGREARPDGLPQLLRRRDHRTHRDRQMSRALARELGRDHIRVNVVSLSFVSDALPRWQSGSESLMSGHSNMLTQLKKRMLFDVRCSDIAEAVAFFAGPRSRAITGQTLSVNGGLSTPG